MSERNIIETIPAEEGEKEFKYFWEGKGLFEKDLNDIIEKRKNEINDLKNEIEKLNQEAEILSKKQLSDLEKEKNDPILREESLYNVHLKSKKEINEKIKNFQIDIKNKEEEIEKVEEEIEKVKIRNVKNLNI